jgi:hypothetical protein
VQVKEPAKVATYILLSIPIMVLNAFLTLVLVGLFVPLSLQYFGVADDSLSISISIPGIALLVAVLVVHEFLHLLLVPGFLRSDKTYAGITIYGGFIYTEEVLTRRRFIAISLMPLVALSVLLPVVLGAAGLLSPLFVLAILLNAIGSSVDIMGLFFVLAQVPPGSSMVCNGMKTYWKNVDGDVLSPA